MKAVLIVASKAGYSTRLFEETARRIGLQPIMATDRCNVLEDPWGDQAIPVHFQSAEESATALLDADPQPAGVIAIGDLATDVAAIVGERLGLRFHSSAAVRACRNKFLSRSALRAAGLPVPSFRRIPVAEGPNLDGAAFPCVLKPLGLSASRGVIRANNASEFRSAFGRIAAIVREERDSYIQVETYIPGAEFALEGLVIDGRLKTLALFDKPDPLEGPFFEEAIYVTPSRQSEAMQSEIRAKVQAAVNALRLTNGPIHAEVRVNEEDVYVLEVAARPIGGLCAQALRFGREGETGLEEVLLRFAVGEDVSGVEREAAASGVMMIPVPASGVFRSVAGVDDARSVTGITAVEITATPGQRLQKLPEGASYPGFLFARADTPENAEAALRGAHARLRFEISAELNALRPGA